MSMKNVSLSPLLETVDNLQAQHTNSWCSLQMCHLSHITTLLSIPALMKKEAVHAMEFLHCFVLKSQTGSFMG